MPNYCENQVLIAGPIEKIKELIKDSFSFQKIFPCPEELLDTVSPTQVVESEEEAIKLNREFLKNKNLALLGSQRTRYISEAENDRRIRDYGFTDWYDWCSNIWGTKWDCSDFELNHREAFSQNHSYAFVSFVTAWGAPEGVFQHLEQEGILVAGVAHTEGGYEPAYSGDTYSASKLFTVEPTCSCSGECFPCHGPVLKKLLPPTDEKECETGECWKDWDISFTLDTTIIKECFEDFSKGN